MLKISHDPELQELGVVRLRGPDAARFLQGQVSADVEKLSPTRSLLAGYHNPQGRVIALLRLVHFDPDDILAVLPRELASTVATRLSKFILRSKVAISDESSKWRVHGVVAADGEGDAISPHESAAPSSFESAGPPGSVGSLGAVGSSAPAGSSGAPVLPTPNLSAHERPGQLNQQTRVGGSLVVRVDDTPPRWLILSAADQPAPLSLLDEGGSALDDAGWRALDVAAGQPQVYAATSEEFVAQMLNLDVLGAIAFDKGCYTGQEVIARAHYRGRVKRRMQRFFTRDPAQLARGDSGQLADGRSFKVIEAVQLSNGHSEFLAVAAFDTADAAPESAGAAAASADVSGAKAVPNASPTTSPTLDVDPLALPYSLPD